MGGRAEPPRQLLDVLLRRALLRPVEPRRVGEARAHVAGNARRHGQLAEHLEQPLPRVHVGRASEGHNQRLWLRATNFRDELAEPAGGRGPDVEPSRIERNCLRSLDNRRSVAENDPARGARRPNASGTSVTLWLRATKSSASSVPPLRRRPGAACTRLRRA